MPHDRSSESQSVPEDSDFLYGSAVPAQVGDHHGESCSQEGNRNSVHSDGHLSSDNYNIPNDFTNLNELASPSPVQNPHEGSYYRQDYLEERRSQEGTSPEN